MLSELEMEVQITKRMLQEAIQASTLAACEYETAKKNLEEFERSQKVEALTTKEILGPWMYVPSFDDGCSEEPGPVLLYQGTYYINIENDHYFLILENRDFSSQCLAELEEYLAEYIIDSGGEPYEEVQPILAEYRGNDYGDDEALADYFDK